MTFLTEFSSRLRLQPVFNQDQLIVKMLDGRGLLRRVVGSSVQGARKRNMSRALSYKSSADGRTCSRPRCTLHISESLQAHESARAPVNTTRESLPNAPIASKRSASCTQCSSAQLSCHSLHSPSFRSFFSFVQDTLLTISEMAFARPSAMRSRPGEECFWKKGRKYE